ncbi:MAG: alkaline phosphatase family protein [Deltaproteobacteria bacterium]|nr:MAG: alkaline phosphatase family protein [Deltaproteobacteria bacterium]
MSRNASVHGPERLGGQGLDPEQEESGNRAIRALLCDPEARDHVDLVVTWRGAARDDGAYEVWARRGMVRFRRLLRDDGALDYEVLEVVGENPLANQDPHALRTLDAEREAARASGFDAEDPARRFIAAAHQSYPFAYERIAQLFDSPNTGDLVVSANDWTLGSQAGQHSALNVRQSRAPLFFAGPRIRPGVHEVAVRSVDIAPTVLAALGFPKVDGADATGRTASERGVEPDTYLRRQDGRVLEEILDGSQPAAQRLYIFLLDGLHPTELEDRLENEPQSIPNLRRLRERAAVLASGSIVTFPSITWPSHTSIGTGAWCGHHDVVNPTYYLREKRESVSPQGQQVHSEGFVSSRVETLYEAFRRVRGAASLCAAIHEPVGRGADHAVLEGRNLCDRARLKALTLELAADCDGRWKRDGLADVERESVIDTRGLAQVIELFTRPDREPPDFVFHELTLTDGAGHDYGPHHAGTKAALDESDRRIGRVLDLLDSLGVLESTLLVVTADHGMSPQDGALRASPAHHVERAGIASIVAEPMIWLRDLAVEVERASDGRTARVLVSDNDATSSGERPALEGAEVLVEIHEREGAPRRLAGGRTGAGGVYGFATPPDVDSERIAVRVSAPGFNPRRLTLDGRSLVIDLCNALYRGAD